MEYRESTMETLVFDILGRWKWLGANQNKYCDFSAAISWCVTEDKYNLWCPKL